MALGNTYAGTQGYGLYGQQSAQAQTASGYPQFWQSKQPWEDEQFLVWLQWKQQQGAHGDFARQDASRNPQVYQQYLRDMERQTTREMLQPVQQYLALMKSAGQQPDPRLIAQFIGQLALPAKKNAVGGGGGKAMTPGAQAQDKLAAMEARAKAKELQDAEVQAAKERAEWKAKRFEREVARVEAVRKGLMTPLEAAQERENEERWQPGTPVLTIQQRREQRMQDMAELAAQREQRLVGAQEERARATGFQENISERRMSLAERKQEERARATGFQENISERRMSLAERKYEDSEEGRRAKDSDNRQAAERFGALVQRLPNTARKLATPTILKMYQAGVPDEAIEAIIVSEHDAATYKDELAKFAMDYKTFTHLETVNEKSVQDARTRIRKLEEMARVNDAMIDVVALALEAAPEDQKLKDKLSEHIGNRAKIAAALEYGNEWLQKAQAQLQEQQAARPQRPTRTPAQPVEPTAPVYRYDSAGNRI